MKYEDEIINRLLNIEATVEEMYKEIIRIRKENDSRILENFHLMCSLENVEDFIKTKYNFGRQKT